MTRKDFQMMAETIAALGRAGAYNAATQREIAENFAHRLAQTNPRFDRARFIKACGV